MIRKFCRVAVLLAWGFERRIEQLDASEGQVGAATEALRLYRGSFLPTDANEPWTAKMRERLRSRIVRLVEVVALAEEDAGRFQAFRV